MNKYMHFAEKLKEILPENRILIDEPMKNHTHFKLGGPADILVIPQSEDELIKTMKVVKEEGIPHFVIGNGSNLIVRDGGISGIVIKLEGLNKIYLKDGKVVAQSGAKLKDVSNFALENSLTGMEFACGIPGSFGGAVFMNAGAYRGEMSFVLESVKVLTKELEVKIIPKEDLELGYRTSSVMKHGHIVIEGTLSLEKGNHDEIKAKIEELTKMREDKQPLEYPSAGSTFKRPEGYFAAALIEEAGLKGYSNLQGTAGVSEKHAGFVINRNNACADEVLEIIEHVKKTVKEKMNVELHTEVLIVGENLK